MLVEEMRAPCGGTNVDLFFLGGGGPKKGAMWSARISDTPSAAAVDDPLLSILGTGGAEVTGEKGKIPVFLNPAIMTGTVRELLNA